jgi:hypothetical protein
MFRQAYRIDHRQFAKMAESSRPLAIGLDYDMTSTGLSFSPPTRVRPIQDGWPRSEGGVQEKVSTTVTYGSGSKKRKKKRKRKRKSKSASNPNAKPEEGSLIEGSTDSHNESKVLKSDDEHSTEDEKTALVADVQQAVEDFSFMSPLEEEILERNYARTRELAKDPDPWATWYGIQHLTWEAKLI